MVACCYDNEGLSWVVLSFWWLPKGEIILLKLCLSFYATHGSNVRTSFWKMEHGDPLILFHFVTACAINNGFWQKNWHILFNPKLSRATLNAMTKFEQSLGRVGMIPKFSQLLVFVLLQTSIFEPLTPPSSCCFSHLSGSATLRHFHLFFALLRVCQFWTGQFQWRSRCRKTTCACVSVCQSWTWSSHCVIITMEVREAHFSLCSFFNV